MRKKLNSKWPMSKRKEQWIYLKRKFSVVRFCVFEENFINHSTVQYNVYWFQAKSKASLKVRDTRTTNNTRAFERRKYDDALECTVTKSPSSFLEHALGKGQKGRKKIFWGRWPSFFDFTLHASILFLNFGNRSKRLRRRKCDVAKSNQNFFIKWFQLSWNFTHFSFENQVNLYTTGKSHKMILFLIISK